MVSKQLWNLLNFVLLIWLHKRGHHLSLAPLLSDLFRSFFNFYFLDSMTQSSWILRNNVSRKKLHLFSLICSWATQEIVNILESFISPHLGWLLMKSPKYACLAEQSSYLWSAMIVWCKIPWKAMVHNNKFLCLSGLWAVGSLWLWADLPESRLSMWNSFLFL